MTQQETVKLRRDVDVILVPFGTPVTLPKDTEVTIAQSFGGTYTVTTPGAMYRIDNKNADALGKANLIFTLAENEDIELENKIWAILRTCYDPEIPVNIVDLGLVYDINIMPDTDNKSNVTIHMTLTAPGCGMGPIIAADAKQKVLSLPEVKTVEVEIVFDPPWDRSMMSEQAKLELGML
ncbi:MAG: putative metal-sulfur cluster biosynthetic enzyme [uncultured bacterium]|nr:MAG: putative metal-sulfur cluster biosynthetic enzyme [uncultured bacterium]